MKFYHVCFGHAEKDKLFLPRVPKSTGKYEDTTTPRICVADTVDHAFSAVCDLPYTTYDEKPITVYSIEMPEECTIQPEFLFKESLVADSLYTREHWILFPVRMEGTHAYMRNFDSDTYRIPDENKRGEFWEWLQERVPSNSLNKYVDCSMDKMLRQVIPSHWDAWHIDEEDIADDIGLESVRVIYNIEILGMEL